MPCCILPLVDPVRAVRIGHHLELLVRLNQSIDETIFMRGFLAGAKFEDRRPIGGRDTLYQPRSLASNNVANLTRPNNTGD